MNKFQLLKTRLGTLLINQFWPLSQFKNASFGNPQQQHHAYQYNQKNAFLLEIPILNWIIVLLINLNALIYIDTLSKEIFINIVFSALAGITFTISFVAALLLTIMYSYLNYVDAKIYRHTDK